MLLLLGSACQTVQTDPDASLRVRCGEGVGEVDGACIRREAIPCGTRLRDGVTGACVLDESCARGTVRRGDACVDPTACVDGTVREGDECVPDG